AGVRVWERIVPRGGNARGRMRQRADMFLYVELTLARHFPRPLVQVLPTGEGAPGQKGSLNKAAWPFYAPRAVRIADGVRHELEAELLVQVGHLRHRHHVASAAAQHEHMRAVDHHAGWGAAQESWNGS